MLQGKVMLRAYMDTWTPEGWLLAVKFDYVKVKPAFAHSAIIPLLNFSSGSSATSYGMPRH